MGICVVIAVALFCCLISYRHGQTKGEDSKGLEIYELRSSLRSAQALNRQRTREAITATMKFKKSRKQLLRLQIIVIRRAPHTRDCKIEGEKKCTCWKADALDIIAENKIGEEAA